jgi:hypothetical protein
MKYVDFLTQWIGYRLANPEQRPGQALLNCLHTRNRSDLYTEIDNKFGIFYNDIDINAAIAYLSTKLD